MSFDLNINNYSLADLMDIYELQQFELNKKSIHTKYNLLSNSLMGAHDNIEKKEKIKQFLNKSYSKLLEFIKKDSYKLIDTDFFNTMVPNETFDSGNNHIIKKQQKNFTGLINPLYTNKTSTLLNINTTFRKNYYNEPSTDFVFNLPTTFKNVVQLTLVDISIPAQSNYTFSSKLRTNEFNIETYNSSAESDISNHQIKIKDGNYTGKELENYLNRYLFSQNDLSRVACEFDNISHKFRFYQDTRTGDNGGINGEDISKCFNINWQLIDDKRPVQLNMGWLLGYRQQYYKWSDDYTLSGETGVFKLEGYCPESTFNPVSKYFLLSIDDFNNNYGTSIVSPFQESAMNNKAILAKIPIYPDLNNVENSNFESKREYFGPVNIDKIRVQLLDEYGRIVDLNNNDYCFTLRIDQQYNVNQK